MAMTADLEAYRTLRALREGRPGVWPSLWNTQAPAVWSILRELYGESEALGWLSSFRFELAQRIERFEPLQPLSSQIGLALVQHLKPPFRARPIGNLPPEAYSLLLVDLFFDIQELLGEDDQERLRAAWRFLGTEAEADALRARVQRRPPDAALLLPPGAEPPPPRPRWHLWTGGLTLLVIVLTWAPWGFGWPVIERQHRQVLAGEGLTLVGAPAVVGQQLAGEHVPSLLLEVPELERCNLSFMGAGVADNAVMLRYQDAAQVWTLQHVARTWPTGDRMLDDGALTAWTSEGTLWVLGAAVPADVVAARAACIRDSQQNHAATFEPL